MLTDTWKQPDNHDQAVSDLLRLTLETFGRSARPENDAAFAAGFAAFVEKNGSDETCAKIIDNVVNAVYKLSPTKCLTLVGTVFNQETELSGETIRALAQSFISFSNDRNCPLRISLQFANIVLKWTEALNDALSQNQSIAPGAAPA